LLTKEHDSILISISEFSKVKRRPPSIEVLFTKELLNNFRNPSIKIEKTPPLFLAEFSFIFLLKKKLIFLQIFIVENNLEMTVFYR